MGTVLDARGGVRAIVWCLVVVGCARGTSPPVPEPDPGDRCDAALPAFATVADGALVARCGALAVSARALVDGVIQLRYAAAGAERRASWAVVGARDDDPGARYGGDGARAIACTAAITVAIDDACRVRATLADGTVIADDLGFTVDDAGARLDRRALADRVYGLGERTGGLDKRGRAWTFWNTDAYDASHGGWAPGQDPLYQAIPLELRLAGAAYGVFTDEPRRMVIDLGAADPARDTITAAGARSLDQYLIAGPRLADVVDRYTRLTGRPALPPRWALGFHQSRWGYVNGDELAAIAARFRSERIPADALWLDIQHQRGYRTFTFDDPTFPETTLDRLAELGFRTVAIEDAGIKVDAGWDVYESGVAGDHFLRRGDGALYVGTAWPGDVVFPDFSRAETRAWWGDHVRAIADRGVAGIWLDLNEPTVFPETGGGASVPDDVAADGDGAPTTMAALHNVYALLEARATYDALAARGTRPFVLSRAGYAGIQRYAAVWTGDTPSTWDGLAQTLPMLLGLGVSGVPIVGSDIGGYSGNASPELYARWLALGSISPFARAHVTIGVPGQEPWRFGDEVTAIARARLEDRYRLLPYLYALAEAASRTGAPVLRPLVWEFQDDPAVATIGDQAMLGPFVLVAPVVEQGATTRRVALPAGRWHELHSGAIYDGPATIEVGAPLAALPMFVRAGAILPVTEADGALALEVYPGAAETRFTLYEDDGEAFTGTRTEVTLAPASDGARLTLSAPRAQAVTVRLHGVDGAVTAVDGAAAFHHDANARAIVATLAPGATALAFHYDPAIPDPRPPVDVTFEVHVPADTPDAAPIHVATSADWDHHVPLTWVAPGVARGTVRLPRGAWFEYKLTRGTWDTVEKRADCGERANRVRLASPEPQVDTVATWRDRC